jgi:DNA-binding response OmpR family regulator
MKVLLAEDEKRMNRALCEILRQEGYEVTSVENGEDALYELESGVYDLVVLDVMMPGMNGFDVAKKARKEGNRTPILMLTAKGELDDKVEGLDSGADDYLTKPFAMQELLARIRMVSRRSAGSVADHRLRAGDLILDTQTYTLACASNSRSVRLGAKEYQLMEYMMRNPDQVLSREQITQRVWGYDADAEYNNVDVYVSFLRKKMKFVQSVSKIGSVRGVGYELEAVAE